jgi:hypothetical protein
MASALKSRLINDDLTGWDVDVVWRYRDAAAETMNKIRYWHWMRRRRAWIAAQAEPSDG